MSFATFAFLSAAGIIALLVGAGIYLKKRGVFRATADAAKQAVATDVQNAVNKVDPPK